MKNRKPPYRATQFLKWFCKSSLFEEISGDLEEEFNEIRASDRAWKSNLAYWLLVFSFFRPYALGIKFKIFNMILFKNHALVALRMMAKHKVFTAINVFGLTLSMIIGLVLITIIIDQKSFDKFHKNGDRIYRITTNSKYQAFGPSKMATTAIPLANELSRDHIEEIVRIRRTLYTDLTYVEEDKTMPVFGHYADASFFKVFSFNMIAGDPLRALSEPFSLVITEKLARKIFRSIDVIGKTVHLEELGEFTITGVMHDIPRRSHMQFELLASFSTVEILEKNEVLWSSLDNWRNYSSSYIYFLLEEGGSTRSIQNEMDQIAAVQYARFTDLDASFRLQALNQIALGQDIGNQIGPTTEKEFVIGISILSFVIFLAAIFNYTNLSVARSLKRSREVGLRKVMGSTRSNITSQFVLESVIIAFLALGIAMMIFELLKPSLDPYLPNRYVSLQLTPTILLAFLLIALLAGLISGFIPAMVMQKVKIAEILKGNASSGLMKRVSIRKGVLAFQFTLSMVLITVAIVAWRQYVFGINYDTGFKKENIYNVYIQGNDPELIEARFTQLPEVEKISYSGFVLSSGTIQNTWVKLEDPMDSMLVKRMMVDSRFTDVHEIQLVAGNEFSPTGGNQALVNMYVLDYFKVSDPQEILGWKLVTSDGYELQIVGITSNFFTDDVGREQTGFYLHYSPDNEYGVVNLSVNYSDPKLLESKIERTWLDLDEGVHDFRGDFFIQQLKDSYDGLTFVMKFVGTFAFLIISIATLGLLGIVIYSIEQRTKEIGIRKTMGAGDFKIVGLLSSSFLKLVAFAGLIAVVIAWLVIFQVILPEMIDKPDIGIKEFILAFVILILPAFLAIFPMVLKASRTNPAVVLRNE